MGISICSAGSRIEWCWPSTADEAGSKAAFRGDELESPFRLDLDLRVATMPDGLDPADLVQEGRGEELAMAVKEARPLLEHRIEHEIAKHDLSGPEGRARALHAASTQLRKVGDTIARREYGRFVARRIGVDLETVESAVAGEKTGPAPLRRFDRAPLRPDRCRVAPPHPRQRRRSWRCEHGGLHR